MWFVSAQFKEESEIGSGVLALRHLCEKFGKLDKNVKHLCRMRDGLKVKLDDLANFKFMYYFHIKTLPLQV